MPLSVPRRSCIAPMVLSIPFAAASAAYAATFSVDTTADSVDSMAGDGLCADTQHRCSLRAAIQEANAWPGDDMIDLPAGDHVLTRTGGGEDFAASGDLDVRSTLTLAGNGASITFIDADGLDRVFDVHAPGRLTLRRVHVGGGVQAQHGGTPEHSAGGGLLVRANAAAELGDVVFAGNRSIENGQAIAVFGSLQAATLHLSHNISEDSFSAGGGLYVGPTATAVSLTDCMIDGNQAQQGGAIAGDGADTAITLERCLVSGNIALSGGGIYANLGASHWLLRNVTISGNSADVGGGLFGDGQNRLRFEHSTVTGNHATGPNGGGAIFDVRGGAGDAFVPVLLVNSIVAGNTQAFGRECATVFPDVIVSGGGTVHAGGDDCRLRAGSGDVITTDARLGPLADNGGASRTHALLAGSPAIDAGIDAACTLVDQRGQPRPLDGDGDGSARCDSGAFEFDDHVFLNGFDTL